MRIRAILILAATFAPIGLSAGQDEPPTGAHDAAPSRDLELDRAVKTLIDALSSQDPKERADAARSLAKIQTSVRGSSSSISRLLRDNEPAVRLAAVDALLCFREQDLRWHFLQVIGDPDPRVQFRAVIGIYRINSRNSAPADDSSEYILASDWYHDAVTRAEKPVVRGLLALAAGQPSEDIREAIPVAMKCLGSGEHDLWHSADDILGESELLPEILWRLTDADVEIRRGTARLLFTFGLDYGDIEKSDYALETLVNGLSDQDALVRRYCLLALIGCKAPDDQRFISMASDADPMIRCIATAALLKFKPEGTQDALLRLSATDPSSRVRVRAAFALAEMAVHAENKFIQGAKLAKKLTDPKAVSLARIGVAYYSNWYGDDDKKGPPILLDAPSALADIRAAIEEERREPMPSFEFSFDFDQFDVELIAAIGAIGPVAQSSVPWLLKELQRFDSLGAGDCRARGVEGRLQSILYALSRMGPAPELIQALDNDRRVVRTVAAMALCKNKELSPKTTPILIASLDQECWGICVFSGMLRNDVACLGSMGHRSAPALLQLLRKEKNSYMAANALELMESDSENVVPLLVPILEDKSEPVKLRATITRALGSVGVNHAGAFEVLRRLLLDPQESEAIRVAAAWWVGVNRAGNGLPPLEECQNDPSSAVRAAVDEAIAQAKRLR